MKLITISGLDGSGKSTQIRLLKEYLEKKGFKVKYFHSPSFSIANKILRQKKSKNLAEKPKSITKAGFFKIFMRKIALAIDTYRFKTFYLPKEKIKGTNFVLADRYFFDQIVNIFFLEKKEFEKKPFWLKIAEKNIIIPDEKIYLETSIEKILQRSPQIEQEKAYFIQKEKLYRKIAQKFLLTKIVGNENQSDIFEKIVAQFEKIK